MLDKQKAKKIMEIKGNIRGEGILTDIKYVHYRKGEKGVKMLEERLEELGCPVELKDVRPMDWYPVWLDVLKMLIIKEIFNWTDKDIFEMGKFAAKVSFLVRMLMKYFVSPQMSFKESPKYWRKNFDFGKLEAHEFNEKEKYMIFRLKEFKVHPITCVNHAGYFLQMARYVLGAKEPTIKETKCMFKGAPYREYMISWR